MNVRLRGPALSKAVRDRIKQYIIDNDLAPGDMLPSEGQFAENLGVGRSSVREAVKALQSLGIVEVRHGNGLFVREWNFDPVLETLNYGFRFDTRTIGELFQIRMWLETAVIGDAVKRITDAEIEALEEIIARWRLRQEADEPTADLDEQFHLTLYGVLGNKTLLKLIAVFWVAFDNVGDQVYKAHDSALVLKNHAELLDAVKTRDTDLARRKLLATFADLHERLSVLEAAASS